LKFSTSTSAAHHLTNEREPLRLSKIYRDASLVAVGTEKVCAHAMMERTPCAAHLAVRQGFDLDDIGAEIGKDHGTERPGQCERQVDYAQALK
jgi:hypothetical protein